MDAGYTQTSERRFFRMAPPSEEVAVQPPMPMPNDHQTTPRQRQQQAKHPPEGGFVTPAESAEEVPDIRRWNL